MYKRQGLENIISLKTKGRAYANSGMHFLLLIKWKEEYINQFLTSENTRSSEL